MTPRRRWRRTNRPQTPRNSLLRSDFPAIAPNTRLKKSPDVLNVRRGCCDLSDVGAVIPPHRLYSARAPIHPKRPYGLTRPVVPPDGSFISGTGFLEEAASCAAPRRLADRKLPSGCVTRRYFPRLFERQFSSVALRNAAMLPCSLTVDRADNSVFLRVFFDCRALRSSTHWTTRKFSTEYPCHVQLIRLGCVCVRLSLTG